MTEDEVRDVVRFVKYHQPWFSSNPEHSDYKLNKDSAFFVKLYRRYDELQKAYVEASKK